jgi:hypothetical protein
MTCERILDLCENSGGSHHDVARAAHAVIGHSFRYLGDGKWEHLTPDGWRPDEKQSELRTQLRIMLGAAFTDRALFWHNMVERVEDREKFDCQLRCYRLSQIAVRLKRDRYLKDLVKECREFFVCESSP